MIPTVPIPEHALAGIHNRESLFDFLERALNWSTSSNDTYTYPGPQLHPDLVGTVNVSEIVKFDSAAKYHIFLLEFSRKVRRSHLREVLRAIRREERFTKRYSLKAIEQIVFVIAEEGYNEIRFAQFREREKGQPQLKVFGWDSTNPVETRTVREHNLPALRLTQNLAGDIDWSVAKWEDAWDVERVTSEFFKDYKLIFEEVRDKHITGVKGDKQLFTQRLFNRLLFIHFLSKKGWLRFGGRTDYLFALRNSTKGQAENLYSDRLYWAFFNGLGVLHTPDQHNIEELVERRGYVPYLNGGLFEMADGDDVKGAVNITNTAFDLILDGLLAPYNFTITESTPEDIEVAVDPEMLGKVFEELVTGRHESGSYYTPRPVVSFMCREALKGYLVASGANAESIAAFVDHYDATRLTNAEKVLDCLKSVKVVDPACGSGAYLLGMLQELMALRQSLFTAKRIDSATAYTRKLEIIANNLYGVDKDPFAVNTARLRLWLSLVVDDERNPLNDSTVDVALPNLDFKIEAGDALLPPDPSNVVGSGIFYLDYVTEYDQEKRKYGSPHYHGDKTALKTKIEGLKAKIAAETGSDPNAFDWRVDFAEVFVSHDPIASIGGGMNFGLELAEPPRPGGFDIVLANPPYVRQEEIGTDKPQLLKQFADAAEGKSDLFVYFYVRGLQLLRPGGIHVFVCSNSWLDVGYGGRLQGYLLQNSRVEAIYESAVERQFATADINTIISIICKAKPIEGAETRFVRLLAPFETAMAEASSRRQVVRTKGQLWAAGLGVPDKKGIQQFDGDKWGGKYLRAPDVYWKILERAGDRLVPLSDVAKVQRGFTTGVNDFYYVRVLREENGIAHVRCDDGSEHLIEAEYVQDPVLVKAREIVRPVITVADLQYRLVRLDENALKKPHAKRYIEWGESSRLDANGNEIGKFHLRPSTRSRRPWFSIKVQGVAAVAFPAAHKRRAVIASLYKDPVQIDKRLYGVYPKLSSHAPVLAVSLISTFSTMCREVHGRANFGQGVLELTVDDTEELPTIDPANPFEFGSLSAAFELLTKRPIQMIYDEVKMADRQTLDDAFLSYCGFEDATERAKTILELQDAACRLVWQRQAKAERTRESRQSYDDWVASGLPFGAVEDE